MTDPGDIIMTPAERAEYLRLVAESWKPRFGRDDGLPEILDQLDQLLTAMPLNELIKRGHELEELERFGGDPDVRH